MFEQQTAVRYRTVSYTHLIGNTEERDSPIFSFRSFFMYAPHFHIISGEVSRSLPLRLKPLPSPFQMCIRDSLQSCQIIGVTDPVWMCAFNEEAAKAAGRDDFSFCHHAPAFFFVLGDKSNRWSEVDGGIIVENMALAAQSLGLGSCIIGMIRDFMDGERGEYWLDRLGAAPNHKFVIGLAVGYPVSQPDPKPRDNSRVKLL